MALRTNLRRVATFALLLSAVLCNVLADDAMRKLIDEKKFADAVKHGEAVAAESRTVEQWIMLGTAYENIAGDAEAQNKARAAYDAAMKVNPSHPAVFIALGDFEFKAGKFADATGHYQRSFLLQRSAPAAEGIAKSAMQLRDRERARDAAESAIAINPDAFDSRMILAEILFDAKSYAAAAPHLEYIASKKSGEIEYWRKLAVCYENLKDADKLAAVDAKIVALDSKDVASRRRLADYRMAKDDAKGALAIYKELALLTPNDPRPFKNLYEASLKDGNKKDGTMYLRNFIMLDSSDAGAIKLLGDLLFEAKDMDGALAEYRKAIRRNANITGLYKNYVKILIDKNADDEALRAMNRAIALKEADAAMYAAIGDIYKKRNDNANAIRMYQAAMERDKQNVALLTKLAESQAAAGDTRNAIVSYEQIVALNPNASAEFKVLGDLVTRAGRTKEGMENYKKYLAKVPTDQEILVRVGLYEYANKEYKSAINYLSKVADTKLITTDVLVALGDSYNRTGDCKQAVTYFERARAANPPNAVLVSILRPLAECYEKSGDKVKAAEAYNAFVALPNVRDADAAFSAGRLREENDMPGAIRRYEANMRSFPRDYRNFMRLGLHQAKSDATLRQAATNLRTASQIVDTVAIVWKTLAEVQGKLKNTGEELAAYNRYLRLVPDDVAANKRVGAIQIERRQFDAGIASLEKVVKARPDDHEAVMMLALGYASTGKHKEAAEQYRRAKALRPDDVGIRLSLIETLEKAKDTTAIREEKRSLAELDRKIVAADAKNVESRQRLVAHSMANRDNAGAYKLLNELAALTPNDQVVFKNLYDIAAADGKRKEAIAHLRKYIALRPGVSEPHKNLGLMLYEEKDYDGALVAFREARRLDPAVKGIYKPFMDVLIRKKIDAEIITVGNAAIAAKEADAATYRAMGDIHTKNNRHADAARMYKGALDIDKQNTALLSVYAESQAKSGDIRGAIVTYQQVTMMNSDAVNEYKELGALLTRQGNHEQAVANYKKYLEKKPDDEEVAIIVANFEYGKKNFAEAVKFYEMVKKPELQNLQYLTRLGDSYFQTEKFKKAAETFEKARKVRNVTPAALREILKPLAISLENDKQLEKAAEAYAAFVALPGVVDQEAAYKRAFLIEKTNQEQAVRFYTANTRSYPRDARNFIRLGTLNAQKDETLAQAADNLTAATRLVENDPAVWLLLAQVNGKLNRTDAELAAYRRYAQLKRDDFSVARRIGEIQYEKKQFAGAITNLEMYLTTNDKDVRAIVMLADAYEATGRQPRAAELLASAKALDGKDPVVRERLYLMYKSQGDKAKAGAEIRELVNLTKDNKHRLMLVDDLVESGKLDEAAKVADEVRKSDPLNFDGLMAVASIQRLQRKFLDAIETYKSVHFLNDKYVPAFAGRAEAHFALGEFDRAETYYKRALELDPKMVSAELGLVRVYRSTGRRDLQSTHLNRARALDPNSRAVQEELRLFNNPAAAAPPPQPAPQPPQPAQPEPPEQPAPPAVQPPAPPPAEQKQQPTPQQPRQQQRQQRQRQQKQGN